jgi:hypothetical protein
MALIATREQRAATRFDASLPVSIDGATGETHNISAHGVYFETDVQRRPGELVNFSLEYTLHGRRHRLLCEGKVVRVDRHGGRVGVATRLVAPFFEATEEVSL